jgi:hypothetical protein
VWLGHPALDLGVPVVPTSGSSWRAIPRDALALRRAHADVVLVTGTDAELGRAALITTLGGARAVLLFPTGTPRKLPRWERRFHRYVLQDQDTARAWARAGVSLGRVVILSPAYTEEALDALIREVLSMSGGPRERPSAALSR